MEKSNKKTIEQQVLESYFNEPVVDKRDADMYINGKWYQVQPVSLLETEEENSDLTFVSECPTYEFKNNIYYIIEQ